MQHCVGGMFTNEHFVLTYITYKRETMKTIIVACIVGAVAFAGAAYAGSCGSCGTAKATTASYKKGATKDLVQTASHAGSFQTLLAAATAAGLVDTLKSDGPLTIFAPTDEAFAALPAGTVESLLKPENKDQLVSILTYHVVPAKVLAADVKPGEAPTVNGQPLSIEKKYGKVKVGEATVVQTDIEATNGVIHVIDAVLIPQA